MIFSAFLAPNGGEPMNLAVMMLIIFGSAKLLAELFERMRLPGVAGEILAGILIGPSVLGWISPSEFTTTMAELGVLFLLFKVGLEVDASELVKVGGTAAIVGTLGVIAPFVGGWGLFQLWGKGQTESIFLGTALTATSVGITAQVLASKGLLNRTASRIILGAAVIDDILALLLLGLVTSVAEGRLNWLELGLTALSAILFIAIVARWGGKTMGKLIPRLQAELRLGEAHFALAMILLFGLAAASTKVGVAAIIGAFLAGMALTEALPPRVHDLAHGVTELLVPFFLANIGLHFRVSIFADRQLLMLALLVVPVAMLTKVLGCGLGASRYGRTVAIRVGAGMIPRGEFCMVVAQTGLEMKAISPETYSLIVFMAITVAVLTPPLLKIVFRGVLANSGPEEERFRLG
ncbi:MAG: cation:proton antiporter [Acidobacteria bacterium]|nr:cation:proton antiporter [Acidobacteriota bacterium]